MIIGNFYLKQTSSGNLLGEYTNTVNEEIFTENARPINGGSSTFAGEYNTSWLEGNKDDPHKSKLIIKAEGNKYKLEWSNLFWGQGFVVDGILIGFYVDEKPKTF
jgi:hypothetical protein